MKAKKSVRKKAKIKKVGKKKPTRKPQAVATKPWSDVTFQGFGAPPPRGSGWGWD